MPPKAAKAKKTTVKLVIDCIVPVNDNIFDVANFEKFLHERIKVEGRTGNLGDKVAIASDKTKITVTAEAPFSKRYLKYLTKKYLKKITLKDYLRVISTEKNEYALRYYDVNEEESGDEE
eukprot:comp24533_c0_seq1/m.46768 comp24533_c0_seq1/g.46768  ORF comp24533_c0_seq1/g.46768 comp24533_c0_seq1/m.46768 type:complete len:120 (-) comp24533_c0_seq1:408-767(-)